MTTLEQIRQAERERDWVRCSRLLRRAGFVKVFRGDNVHSLPCPHCGLRASGWGAWDDDIDSDTWDTLRKVGAVYRCQPAWDPDKGCGGLFTVRYDWS